MIDHSKPWVAYCTAPQFAKEAGQRLRAKDGSVIVIVRVTPPVYIADQMRYRYSYFTRAATAAEAQQAEAADQAAAAAKAAATRAAMAADGAHLA